MEPFDNFVPLPFSVITAPSIEKLDHAHFHGYFVGLDLKGNGEKIHFDISISTFDRVDEHKVVIGALVRYEQRACWLRCEIFDTTREVVDNEDIRGTAVLTDYRFKKSYENLPAQSIKRSL